MNKNINYLQANHPDKLAQFLNMEINKLMQELEKNGGGIPYALLGELATNHYVGPESFSEVVDLGGGFELFREAEVPVEERWQVNNLPENVTVLSYEDGEINQDLDRITVLANTVDDPNNSQHTNEKIEYKGKVGGIFARMTEHYEANKQENTIPVILLRGAEALKQYFPSAENGYLEVDAKRLDMYEMGDNGRPDNNKRVMKFGLDNWKGLDTMQKHESVHLVIPDDCISTAGSMMAAIYALYQKYGVEKIEKITIYAAVGVQYGVQELISFAQDLGLDLEIVIGQITYAYDKNFYLRRVKGEANSKGGVYKGDEAVVGDMGNWMS